MPDYSHLKTRIAESRYVLAAHYLEPCMNLVEVGGHTLHKHMGRDYLGSVRHFWNVDPGAEREYWNCVQTYAMPVTALDFDNVLAGRERKGLCMLGLEMYDEAYGVGSGMASCEHIAESLHHFDTVVIEFVVENPVAKTQALILLGAATYGCGLTRTIHFTTQWASDSKYPEPNESFSKTREFWVLEKT